MPKVPRTYTVYQLDPDYNEDGSKRILEDKGCGQISPDDENMELKLQLMWEDYCKS